MSTQTTEREIILLESFLKKKSPKTFLGRPFWQERYFVLTPTQLCYYKRKEDIYNEEKCLGYIPISAVLGALKVPTCSKNLQFDVVLEGSSRLFQLEAPTPDSRDQWIARVNSAVEKNGRKPLSVLPMATPGHTKEKFWKPQVARNLAKRRQAITDDHLLRKVDEEEIRQRDYSKTEDEVQSLLVTLRDTVPTFQFLDHDSLMKLIKLMWAAKFRAGDTVVEQNTLSNNFHVIISGSFVSSRYEPAPSPGQPIYEENVSDPEMTPTSSSSGRLTGSLGNGKSPVMGNTSIQQQQYISQGQHPFSPTANDPYQNRVKPSLSINPSLEHSTSSGQFSSFALPPSTSRYGGESPLLTSTTYGGGQSFFPGNRTANKIGILQPGEFFGELAFVFKSEATHTIKCREPSKTFTLDYSTYYDFIVEIRKNLLFNRTQILRGLPMFAKMAAEHVSVVSDVLEIRRFKSGDVIIKEGDTSDGFYILRAGAAKVLRHGQLKFIYQDKSDYFGEYSLVTQRPSPCTIIASSEAEFLHIPAQDFAALLPVMTHFFGLVENYKSLDELPSFNDSDQYHASDHDKSLNYLFIIPYHQPQAAKQPKKDSLETDQQKPQKKVVTTTITTVTTTVTRSGEPSEVMEIASAEDDDVPPPPPPEDDEFDADDDMPPPPPPEDVDHSAAAVVTISAQQDNTVTFNDMYDDDDDDEDDDYDDDDDHDTMPFRKGTIRFIDQDDMANHHLPLDLPTIDTLPETAPPVGLPTMNEFSTQHCQDTEPAHELYINAKVDHEDVTPDDVPEVEERQVTPEDTQTQQQKSAIALENQKKLLQYGNGLDHECTVTSLEELNILGTLGRGTFGHVQLVADKRGHTYALKAVSKAHVVRHNQTTHILNERSIMLELHHPFIVRLYRTLRDKNFLYFILEPSLGGELFSLLRNYNNFDNATSKFYAAIVVSVFEYLHSKDILYRDLKPENLLMDADGYVRVTDFGFAKKTRERTYTFCGTPDYLAPEIVSSSGHHTGADWWCLGILIYEMLCGYTPFYDESGPTQMYSKILAGKLYFPPTVSQTARHLIGSLLQTKPSRRLGVLVGGASAIKRHEWFDGMDWDKLYNRELPSPIPMNIKDKYDLSNFDAYPEDEVENEEFVADPNNPWDSVF